MDSAIKAGARVIGVKQPKLKRFHGRYLQQHPPEKSLLRKKCTFRGRKRDQNSERYSGIKKMPV